MSDPKFDWTEILPEPERTKVRADLEAKNGTFLENFPTREELQEARREGLAALERAKAIVDDPCECPRCGRMHRNLGFGRPPAGRAPVTLQELEAILAEPDRPVEILIDGTVRPLIALNADQRE